MGSAPYLGGGFGHFYAYAPTKIEYAIDRFAMEVKRQLDVLDRRLAESDVSGRRRLHDRRHGGLALVRRRWRRAGSTAAGEFLQVQDYKNVQRWTDAIAERPAVQARAHGQPRLGRAVRASCTNAMTPATSRRGRRTSWRRIRQAATKAKAPPLTPPRFAARREGKALSPPRLRGGAGGGALGADLCVTTKTRDCAAAQEPCGAH